MDGVPPPLRKIVFKLGKDKGLDENLLNSVLKHLVKNQYLSKGDRTHSVVELQRILRGFEK